MSSKIGGVEGSHSATVDSGRAVQRPQGAAGGAVQGPTDIPGSVHITSTASQLAALEQALRDMPAVDQARVAALRTAIEQGTYTVVPQRIADQLMQLEQAFSGLPAEEDPAQK